MKITRYFLKTPLKHPYRLALLSDLHSKVPAGLSALLYREAPDAILIAGDLMDCRDAACEGRPRTGGCCGVMLPFLTELVALAPVFYAPGNHDRLPPRCAASMEEAGVRYLADRYVTWQEFTIGGLASGLPSEHRGFSGNFKKTPLPNTAFLSSFAAKPGYKLLLCHHPEYYDRLIKDLPIDLVLSGHAHGGHWTLFGRGLFAPGQGLFPRYTAGIYDGRLVVSRGLGNHTPIPRLNNPEECVFLHLTPAKP